MVLAASLILCGIGCGGGEKPSKTEPNSNTETPASPEDIEKSAAVIKSFITAILKGDDEAAFALLSPKAQEEYKKMNYGFGFPANDQTEFQINAVTPIPGSDNTHFGVFVTMNEKDGEDVIVTLSNWGVRKDFGKFHVVGVVLQGEDQTMELNFEDLVGSREKMQEQARIATAPQNSEIQPPIQNQFAVPPGTVPPNTIPGQNPQQGIGINPQSQGPSAPLR
jgi:hypothetical protein